MEFGQITLSANGKKEKNIFELEYLISVSGANSKLEDFDIDTIDDSNLDYTSALGSEQLGLLIVKNLAKILNAKIGFTHEAGKDITYAILINQEIADSTSNASVDEIKPEQREEKFIEERQVEEKKEEPKEEEKTVEEAPAEEKKEEPEAKEEVKEEPKEEEKSTEEPVEEKKEEPEAKEEEKEEPKEEKPAEETPVEEKKEEPTEETETSEKEGGVSNV